MAVLTGLKPERGWNTPIFHQNAKKNDSNFSFNPFQNRAFCDAVKYQTNLEAKLFSSGPILLNHDSFFGFSNTSQGD